MSQGAYCPIFCFFFSRYMSVLPILLSYLLYVGRGRKGMITKDLFESP